jgi:hypothetical protein
MTDYEVSFKGQPNSTMRVEADNPQQAMDNFLKIAGNPQSSEVTVNEWNENSSHRAHTTSTKEDSSSTLEDSSDTLLSHKLDKLYDVMNHIRWIGLSIGCMFALTFIVPQCTGS